ncbi:MAG TPA: sigma-E processing peptidase SpoIIGA [Candidatus Paenibacillus intestinavium]|nr:sigma-E processing peptidase SpoIIGA [Candidatus Paenibacillus intestinavium]
MKVYLDVLLLRELLVDGVLLLTTGWIRGFKPKAWRVLLAGSVGALYTMAMIFPNLSSLYHISIKLFVSILMIYITFGYYSLQTFLRDIVSFYIVSFVAAGGMMALYFLLMRSSQEVWANVLFIGGAVTTKLHIGIFYLFASFSIVLFLFTSFMRSKKKHQLVESHLADVEVDIDGQIFMCTGLIDTGNQLYDPLTKCPVMIIEVSTLQDALPEKFLKALKQGETNDALMLLSDEKVQFEWQDRIRIIPFRGVNNGSQFLLAVKPDCVKVNYGGKSFESIKVLIGFDGGQLSGDGAYQAIIHPSMVGFDNDE